MTPTKSDGETTTNDLLSRLLCQYYSVTSSGSIVEDIPFFKATFHVVYRVVCFIILVSERHCGVMVWVLAFLVVQKDSGSKSPSIV